MHLIGRIHGATVGATIAPTIAPCIRPIVFPLEFRGDVNYEETMSWGYSVVKVA